MLRTLNLDGETTEWRADSSESTANAGLTHYKETDPFAASCQPDVNFCARAVLGWWSKWRTFTS